MKDGLGRWQAAAQALEARIACRLESLGRAWWCASRPLETRCEVVWLAELMPQPAIAECKHDAGTFVPVIDRNRCEGKAKCVDVCPVGVFALGTLPSAQRAGLTLRGKLKGTVHRWRQALLASAQACEGCGLCVKACPESAITLSRA